MISTPDGIEAAAGLKKAELGQYSSTLPIRLRSLSATPPRGATSPSEVRLSGRDLLRLAAAAPELL